MEKQPYAVSDKTQLQQIAAWKPHAACLTLWYDGEMVHAAQVKNTEAWFTAQGVACRLRDARRDIPAYAPMFVSKRQLPSVPVYFRVDMLKVLLQRHFLHYGKANEIHVVADIDIAARDPGFNPYVTQRLRQFGIMYALKKATMHEIENGWCVTAPKVDMNKEAVALCDKTLRIAVLLSMMRLQHASNMASVAGCVYESLKQAMTWLMGHMFDMPLVRIAGTAPDGSMLLEEYDPFTVDGPFWKEGNVPSLQTLRPLVIEDSGRGDAFEGAEQHWQLVWKRPIMQVSQLERKPPQLVAEPYAIPSLHMYSEVEFDLLPIQYIDIGETGGVDNWVKADL